MTHPIIGWEQKTAVPNNHQFNDYLQVKNGRLHLHNLDLAELMLSGAYPSPLELIYLPLIRQRISKMRAIFADVMDEIGYQGAFLYAYASKANVAEEVVRTTLEMGVHHEMSSTVDIDIARLFKRRGVLADDKYVICNGFKPDGSVYADNIVRLREEHEKVLPVIEDLTEIAPFARAEHTFEVGLRQKSYGDNATTLEEMDKCNSRFGLNSNGLWQAAKTIADAPNLTLTLYHAMVGSQIMDDDVFMDRIAPGIEFYGRLCQQHPTLHIFDFGGGMPVPMTLNFDFDYRAFVRRLLTKIQAVCAHYDIPEPDVMGEFGRYTVTEHGAHFFKIVTAKDNGSPLPWYLIDGSIMTSFPDSWALSEHFIVLPLNHLDKPFRQVQLGGITCDSDDVYPPKPSNSPLFLPVDVDDLYIGFFAIGAYQEMLGGVGGSKHCVLPEANELVIDDNPSGDGYTFQTLPGQTHTDVLRNLGYHRA